MRDYRKGLALPGAFLLLASYAQADSLTPPHEPKDNRFYVCYEERCINYTIHPIESRLIYHKYAYHGCIISSTSCCKLKIKKPHGQPVKLKPFGLFNNYPQALNAFYRCAYS